MTCEDIKIGDIPTFDKLSDFDIYFYQQKTAYNLWSAIKNMSRNEKNLLKVKKIGNKALKYDGRTISLCRHVLKDNSYLHYYVYVDTNELVEDIIVCVPADRGCSSISLYIPKWNALTSSNSDGVYVV